VLYLKVRGTWVLPTPDEDVPAGQFKLLQVQGTVTVQNPPYDSAATPGAEGQLISPASLVATGPDSTVAVLMPGNQSIRLGPDSSAVVEQSTVDAVYKTTIGLRSGNVFARVGKPANGSADFRVRTPNAIAAARGTEFVTFWRNASSITCTALGTVDMLDPEGKNLGTMKNVKFGNIGFRAEPPISEGDCAEVVDTMFGQIKRVNQTAGATGNEDPLYYFVPVKLKDSTAPVELLESFKRTAVYPTPIPSPTSSPAMEARSNREITDYIVGGVGVLLLLGVAMMLFFQARR
jgi:hypothetical protein